jgi:hypothetical protein
MSLNALFLRFTLIYIAILMVVAIALAAIGITGNSGVNTAALLTAVMWACQTFAKKNSRYFSKEEKTRVVLGMLAIDLVLQTVLAVAVAGVGSTKLTLGPMLFAIAFIGLLHVLVIYYFVGMTGKQYEKQAAKAASLSATNLPKT